MKLYIEDNDGVRLLVLDNIEYADLEDEEEGGDVLKAIDDVIGRLE